jgi:hypothetical protein
VFRALVPDHGNSEAWQFDGWFQQMQRQQIGKRSCNALGQRDDVVRLGIDAGITTQAV